MLSITAKADLHKVTMQYLHSEQVFARAMKSVQTKRLELRAAYLAGKKAAG